MPCTPEAVDVFRKANVVIAPAMAAGAGGVCMPFAFSQPFILHSVTLKEWHDEIVNLQNIFQSSCAVILF